MEPEENLTNFKKMGLNTYSGLELIVILLNSHCKYHRKKEAAQCWNNWGGSHIRNSIVQ